MRRTTLHDGQPLWCLKATEARVLDHHVQGYLDHGVRVEEGDVVLDVGANIGAKLQSDQAEADKSIAQAKAESRRAMAVAEEQEMRARYQEALAKVQEAEAQVPLAMADALRSGNIGVMDYYNLKNVVADTDMRSSLGQMADDEGKGS